jgi:hypothetical protein
MSAVATPTRQNILSLYSSLLRTSRSFASYNFRTYFERSTRRKFREHAKESDPATIAVLYKDGLEELAVLRRAALVNRLYEAPKLVVERDPPTWDGRLPKA